MPEPGPIGPNPLHLQEFRHKMSNANYTMGIALGQAIKPLAGER